MFHTCIGMTLLRRSGGVVEWEVGVGGELRSGLGNAGVVSGSGTLEGDGGMRTRRALFSRRTSRRLRRRSGSGWAGGLGAPRKSGASECPTRRNRKPANQSQLKLGMVF
jgi:hypothetical protein